jgi:FkbM family methyltransferase
MHVRSIEELEREVIGGCAEGVASIRIDAMNFSGISNGSLVGRALRSPFRLIPAKTAVPILQGPLRGRRWIVGSATHGCWLGSYEFETQRAFGRLVRPGDVVYDLGANVGFYSLLGTRLAGEMGAVYSFEPLPRNLEFLRKHVAMNGLKNCDVIAAAVADFDGEMKFESSEAPATAHLSEGGDVAVRVVRLDSLVERGEIRPPSVMKIDVECSEVKLLLGAAKTIEEYRPRILLATHDRELHAECVGFLERRGYRVEMLTELSIEGAELVALP